MSKGKGKAKAKAKKPAAKKSTRRKSAKQANVSQLFQPKRLPSQILVGKRHRKDFGDLKGLAASIDERGALLQPIVITPENKLIAGDRRLRAWGLSKFAGTPIPVHVVDIDAIVAGEWDENAQRKDFTPSESVAIKKEIEALLKVHAKARQRAHGGSAPGRSAGETAGKGNASDQAAKFTNKSRRTIEKAEAVVAAAERDPKRFGKLQADMDRTGKVDGPFRRLQIMQQTQALRDAPPPLPMRGPYMAGTIDFPWAAEKDADQESIDSRGRSMRGYPEMSLEAGVKLFRSKEFRGLWAKDHTLYFWTTNHHMDHAFTLLKAAGYETHSTIGTWAKNKMGRGQVLRGQTEHCIIATMGKPTINLTNQTTLWQGPGWDVREDSRKPDAFYALVEELTPAPRYAEIFSRGGRGDNWDCHGDEVGKFAPSVPKERQAEILKPLEQSEDERMLVALEAIEKGEQPDLRLWGKKEIKQLERYAEGAKKLKLTSSGKSHLADLHADRRYNEHLASLPEAREALVPLYAATLREKHDAILVKDRTAACAADLRLQAIVNKNENGGKHRLYGGRLTWSSKFEQLTAQTAAPLGQVPMWGQVGLFSLEVDGVRMLIHATADFEFTAYPVDSDKPFLGGESFKVTMGLSIDDDPEWGDYDSVEGLTVDQFVAREIRTETKASQKARGKDKAIRIALEIPDQVYVLPEIWNGIAPPKLVSVKKAKSVSTAAASKRSKAKKEKAPKVGDAIKDAIAARTLPGRPQELIDFATKNGHVMRMHNDATHNFATCQCGEFEYAFEVPGKPGAGGSDPKIVAARIAAHKACDDAITQHWHLMQTQAAAADALKAAPAKQSSKRSTADEPAAAPNGNGGHSAGAAAVPEGDDDQLEIPAFLRRQEAAE